MPAGIACVLGPRPGPRAQAQGPPICTKAQRLQSAQSTLSSAHASRAQPLRVSHMTHSTVESESHDPHSTFNYVDVDVDVDVERTHVTHLNFRRESPSLRIFGLCLSSHFSASACGVWLCVFLEHVLGHQLMSQGHIGGLASRSMSKGHFDK